MGEGALQEYSDRQSNATQRSTNQSKARKKVHGWVRFVGEGVRKIKQESNKRIKAGFCLRHRVVLVIGDEIAIEEGRKEREQQLPP